MRKQRSSSKGSIVIYFPIHRVFVFLSNNVLNHHEDKLPELSRYTFHRRNNLIVRQYSDVSLDDESLFQHLIFPTSTLNVNSWESDDDWYRLDNGNYCPVQVFFDRSTRKQKERERKWSRLQWEIITILQAARNPSFFRRTSWTVAKAPLPTSRMIS